MMLIIGSIVALLVIVGLFGYGLTRGSTDGPEFDEFEDTPEAWQERRVIPGETREEARARLAKYRK